MGIKGKLFGLGAALTMGLTLISPASASTLTTKAVQVTVGDSGSLPTVVVAATGTGGVADFGTVNLDAQGNPGTGVVPVTSAGTAIIGIQVTGDTKLFRPDTTTFSMSLAGGALPLQSPPDDTTYYGANMVNFQIPGRYMTIAGVTNPAQDKWTGAGSPSCTAWTNNGSEGCAPKDSNGTKPIYHVGDAQGIFGTCGIPGSVAPTTFYSSSSCGDTSFSSTGNTTVMILHNGSGTVTSSVAVQLGLNIPAGVYPGVYAGTVNIDTTVS